MPIPLFQITVILYKVLEWEYELTPGIVAWSGRYLPYRVFAVCIETYDAYCTITDSVPAIERAGTFAVLG